MFPPGRKRGNFPIYIEVLAPHLSLAFAMSRLPDLRRHSSSSTEADEPQPSTSSAPPPKALRRRSLRPRSRSSLWSPNFSEDNGDEWLPKTLEDAVDPRFDIPSSEDELDVSQNAPGTKKFVWRRKDNVPRRESFQGDPGVKAALDATSTPLQIFGGCFFTDQLLDLIVEETNR